MKWMAYLVAWWQRNSLRRLRTAVDELGAGKLDIALPFTDQDNDIGALARSIAVLQQEARQLATQRWIKGSQAAIQAELQSASTPTELARRFLTRLAPLINVGHAVFYVYEPDNRQLRLLAGYAFNERKKVKQTFALGHGLVGQCALERMPIVITDPPEDYIHIATTLGHTRPRAISALPVVHNGQLMAVVELATLDAFGPAQEALLDDLLPILGSSLEILERAEIAQVLLAETRRQAEKMEAQAARLEEQAVEMEAQQMAIKATEAWFREILESAPDGMLVIDAEGTIILANRQVDVIFSYPSGALLGQAIEVLVPEAIREVHVGWRNQFIQDVRQTRNNRELRAVSQDGIEFAVEIGLAKLPDVGGRGICICVAVRDITEKKRAAQEVEQQRATMAALLDALPDPIYYKDSGGTYLGCNAAYARRVGKSLEDVVAHTDYGIYPPEQAFNVRNADQRVIDELTVQRCEEWIELADGNKQCLDTVRSPFRDSTGHLLGVLNIGRDITKRKAAEEKIHESEERLNAAMQGANLGLWDWQANPDVLVTNDIWSEMLGYSKQELDDLYGNVAARWDNMVWPEDMDRSVAAFARYVNNEIPEHRMELRMKTRSGEPKWILVVGAAVGRDADGKVTRMVGIHQDITERKAAEAEVLRAKQLAEDTTKAKSDFLANMSHEIRTPMNAIIGMSHLALQTNLDKKQKNYIAKVHRAGENLLGIINDILDFSKIEAGKMSMEKADFHLEDVMDHLANLVGMKTEDKGLELLFSTAPDVPTALVGDSLRLGQILINLGNNAVKFTESGEIVVGVEKIAQTDNDIELHFWVRDTGIGMTPEQCGKMFQSFSQADASTTRKYGGTGLGLAISKNLVELMQGRIWVESEAGKGSSFHFHAHFGLQKEPMPRRIFRADELIGVRVLVVDDNASAREILASMAKNFGLEVDAAWNGQNALQMIGNAEKKQLPYDLVLMDWKMPGMDGIETVQKLQDEHLSRTPAVIMVTAYGREEALGDAEHRGVNLKSVLTKPVTQSTLLEAIGETLGKGIIAETRSMEKADDNAESVAALKGARVLLVEDNEMNQELAMELLSQAGMEVVLANNGKEAVDIIAQDTRFDGVLMDCQMPVMDGYTATREIRKNPQCAKLPIIAMTANAMAGDKEKVIEAGMWDHIAKPLNVTEMFTTIAKWIKPAAEKADITEDNARGTPVSEALAAVKPVGSLPDLPGIDVKAGMATCTNKASLYTRMLIKFRDSQGLFAELFAAAKNDPDLVAPTRCAHTLKGTAGNIGAKALQAAAGELEHACLEGKPAEEIEALLQKALTELALVMPGLKNIGVTEGNTRAADGTATAASSKTLAIPEAELKSALEKLKGLLEDSDSEAGDLLSDLLDKLNKSPLAKQLKPVAAAIEGFDFDAALEKLKGIKI